MQDQLDHLCALVARHARDLMTPTPIPRLSLNIGREPTDLQHGLMEPMLCLVLQGAKEVVVGGRSMRYDPASYFIASVELAACGRVTEASPARPYLSAALRLDPEILAGLIPEVPSQPGPETSVAGYAVSPVTPPLLDAWARLLALLDAPQDAAVLAPLLEREILYRLLQGPQADALRRIARADSRLSQVRRAIGWIRANFDRPLRIEDLAELSGMSPATFHRHFRTATAMSPLQFQKSLRLQQARQLLIADHDAARAGYAVGYESASQFSREYARLFGMPPARDAHRLRMDEGAMAQAGAV